MPLNVHPQYETTMRVTDQAEGRARWIRCPAEMTERSQTFVHKRFKLYPVGTHLLVEFRVSPNMRMVTRVIEITEKEATSRELNWTGKSGEIPDSVINEPPVIRKIEPELLPKRPKIGAVDVWRQGVFFPQRCELAFRAAKQLSDSGATVNMLMAGPSGYGKTTMPEAFAREYGMHFLRVNCASVRDTEEWFGYREARQGSTEFVPTQFTQMVRDGNAVIVLDEFNRVEPWLHNTLFPMLDDARRTVIHSEEIVVGPKVIFVMTINEGMQFTGTFQIDAAMLNRVDMIVPVGPLPRHIEVQLVHDRTGLGKFFGEEELITKVVDVMNRLREEIAKSGLEFDASTRSSLKVGRLLAAGVPPREAFQLALLNGVPAEQAKPVIDIVSASF